MKFNNFFEKIKITKTTSAFSMDTSMLLKCNYVLSIVIRSRDPPSLWRSAERSLSFPWVVTGGVFGFELWWTNGGKVLKPLKTKSLERSRWLDLWLVFFGFLGQRRVVSKMSSSSYPTEYFFAVITSTSCSLVFDGKFWRQYGHGNKFQASFAQPPFSSLSPFDIDYVSHFYHCL